MAISDSPSSHAVGAIPSVREVAASVAVFTGGLLALYLVAFDQGALSQAGMYLHELMHDGRHLLGVPCH